MKEKKTKAQKIEELAEIISMLGDAKLEAVYTFVTNLVAPAPYKFTEQEASLLEERRAKYEKGESKGILAEEAIAKLREELKNTGLE